MSLWQDVRFGVRLLVKDRWFTLAAVVALALGIGANATVFTLVNAVLVRDLPFDEPDKIVLLGTRNPEGRESNSVSIRDYEDIEDASSSFDGLAMWGSYVFNVSDEGRVPERFSGVYISANVFRLIGVEPLLGRGFLPEDDTPDAPPVAVLAHDVWTNRYGADPSVIGRSVTINGFVATVVAVMPEDMKFPPNTDVWVPITHHPPGVRNLNRDARNYAVFGRLADGVSVERAAVEVGAIGERLSAEYEDTNAGFTPTVSTFQEQANPGELRLIFLSLMGAVAFVLLIACANVANLLLARSAQRAREISVRVTLGATRARIVRQLLVESTLLAAFAGLLGFGLAVVGVRLFDVTVANFGKPYYMAFTFDPVVFVFLALICLGTGVAFGLAPALHVSKTNVNEVLNEGGRSASGGTRVRRWTSALIAGELALTLVLLAGAGFMMRSFLAMYTTEQGFSTENLTVMQMGLPDRKYGSPELRAAFFDQLSERLDGVGAIQASSLMSNAPNSGAALRSFEIEGQPLDREEDRPSTSGVGVGTRYFETLDMTLLRGRALTARDGLPGYESVVVNQRFVALHFGREDPVGRRIRFPDANDPEAEAP